MSETPELIKIDFGDASNQSLVNTPAQKILSLSFEFCEQLLHGRAKVRGQRHIAVVGRAQLARDVLI